MTVVFDPSVWVRRSLPVIRAWGVPAEAKVRDASKTQELLDLIGFHGYLKPIVDRSTDGPTRTAAVDRGGVTYEVVEAHRQRVKDVTDHSFVGDAGAGVYPGALIQGASLYIGDAAPIIVGRAPGTITMATEFIPGASSGAEQQAPKTKSAKVDNPTLAEVTDARIQLLNDLNPADGTGLLKTSYESAHAWGETTVAAGISAHGLTWGAEGYLNYNQKYDKSTVVFVLKQIFYTCVFTPGASGIDGFLAQSVTREDLLPYLPESYRPGEASPPLWIDSVSYGRMLVIEVTAETSSDDLKAGIKAHYDWAVGGAKGNLDAAVEKHLETATARVAAVGTGAAGLPRDLTNPLKDLQQMYQDASKVSVTNPGAIVSFTARHVMNNTLAHVGLTGSWVQPISARGVDQSGDYAVFDGPQGGTVNTGIDVAPGDLVTISANGEIYPGLLFFGNASPDGWKGWAPPDGAPVSRDQGGDAFSLVARYGSDPWFQVGSNYRRLEKDLADTAPLQLGINDDNPRNGNPANQWTVHVDVRRRDAAAARVFL